MMRTTHKVAIITGASGDIGASLVAGYRRRNWAVVASSAAIRQSQEPDLVTVAGDITEAGVVISKPFTAYTAADYATVVGIGLSGFFWLTQRAIGEMAVRYGGHVVNISATVAEVAGAGAPAALAAVTEGGLAAATRSLAIEYAAFGIRVNAVHPGVIRTSAHRGAGSSGPFG